MPERTYTILAERIPPDSLTIDCRRPQKLYRYSNATWLERSLKLGEFRLRPSADYKDLLMDSARNDDELVRVQSTEGKYVTITHVETGQDIKPMGHVSYRSEIHTNYLVSCFSCVWDPSLFDEFSGSDACLLSTTLTNSANGCTRQRKLNFRRASASMDLSYMGNQVPSRVFSQNRFAFCSNKSGDLRGCPKSLLNHSIRSFLALGASKVWLSCDEETGDN